MIIETFVELDENLKSAVIWGKNHQYTFARLRFQLSEILGGFKGHKCMYQRNKVVYTVHLMSFSKSTLRQNFIEGISCKHNIYL